MLATFESTAPTEQDRLMAQSGSETLAQLLARNDSVSLQAGEQEIRLSSQTALMIQNMLQQIGEAGSSSFCPSKRF